MPQDVTLKETLAIGCANMTYEQFSATVWHESQCHGSELLPYAEIVARSNGYHVYCPVTDADVQNNKCLSVHATYGLAERALYDAAIKNNLL